MSHDFEAMRFAMVESQLRTTAVDDLRVVKAMGHIPREAFVPAEKSALAYADMLLPLGEGRRMNLPMATGRLLTELALTPDDHVLVVGAGSGYSAALCAELAKSVVALEENAEIAAIGADALRALGNVESAAGPLTEGWAAGAPYDAILVDGAVEHLPGAIIDQLADGGRLAAALVEDGMIRLVYGRKQGGSFGATAFADALAAGLPGFEQPKAFVF
ncbi:protein-L-isoaspartate O-methyltransferase family protein [Parasphingopyxis marina]|uniref:Protein-L-isoaspartate O-methyltransferase n=1 Tax=Parasphingopyxis marina TaxID=2761622 RepID=A0A842I1E5_9SPHN|nr:protein-L-isoaspartate O-methyltransferase [Parasphingopyxis marina]MBC2778020.1 protein-L-isoaspartate O-methyltransferase [Parasphingopyxis marina]